MYLKEWEKCGGLWIDKAIFEAIFASRQRQAAVLSDQFGPMPHVTVEPNPRYLPCPRCGQLMNRLNFAHASGVIIDICQPHGIWFDRDELRRIIEFIRSGGIDRARQKEKEQLDEARRQLLAARGSTIPRDDVLWSGNYSNSELITAFGLAGNLLGRFLR